MNCGYFDPEQVADCLMVEALTTKGASNLEEFVENLNEKQLSDFEQKRGTCVERAADTVRDEIIRAVVLARRSYFYMEREDSTKAGFIEFLNDEGNISPGERELVYEGLSYMKKLTAPRI